ncbi:hypothetical protein [Aidingimonas halophila]|uniref:Uncharacterized protein n=1 Tax=Aidingimonas halophila TaxID=574349 RepID=A0A1H3FIK0_9GAMM|nr:hypothetical protein [Aidingimonas halophila]GHC37939.1 hypothetical protein GCM10008094_34100 [Aidingimonas halophila]SDX89964.1 hypothetical protein SAMN05443545_10818 [Aidingimonas halophila]
MKYATAMVKAVAGSALVLGVIGQASAMGGVNTHTLEAGTSSSQQVAGTQRYTLQVDQPSQLEIRSRDLGSGDAAYYRLQGVLLDDQGNVVAEADQVGGQIALDQSVQPGDYVLEVNGQSLGGTREGMNSYVLETQL